MRYHAAGITDQKLRKRGGDEWNEGKYRMRIKRAGCHSLEMETNNA